MALFVLTRAPQLAVWVLAVALGVQVVVSVTDLVDWHVSRPVRAPAVKASTAHPLDLTALAKGHLFGIAPPPAPAEGKNAPPTILPLVLTGILAATKPKDSMAIIGTSAGDAKVYPVGQRVPGNARVQAIYIDRVLLDRNGLIEALILPRKFGGGGSPAQAMRPEPSALDRLRDTIASASDPPSDALGAKPVFVEGKLRGYRVYPADNSRMGLRRGDLVVAINGTALDDPTRGNDILSGLGNTDQARVTVMRGGKPHEITVNKAAIAN
jgi:general secretion pathway protein C